MYQFVFINDKKMVRCAIHVVFALGLTMPVCSMRGQEPEPAGIRYEDKACGPRCVEFLLKHFGHSADLIELIKELQWPDLEAGTNLETIKNCIISRGLYAYPVRFDSHDVPYLEAPIILHLGRNESSDGGHFCVLMPNSTKGHLVAIWDGAAGYRVLEKQALLESLTGVGLAVSSTPLDEKALEVRASRRSPIVFLFGIVALAGGAFSLWKNLFRKGEM
ncbi:MAG: hypothetical protein KatS3mg111_0763 [Pirellulaceae bacterium]|nr:MAG: hypothetical protein KatS3mg111_0763 [Pirellulaceae bacterium]